MSAQNARDLHYGRRGGGWSESTGIVDGPACEACGKPMLGGQRKRHGVCSPQLECCGAYADLVPDHAKHAKDHADMARSA